MINKYDYKKNENELLKHWKNIKLLEKLEKKNNKGKPFFLLDGPPYANNIPHVGHIRNTVLKDFYVRWAFMKGFNVLFQPGFDTHGLPIENMVEKNLKLTSKKDIEKTGINKFVKECRNSATINKDLWIEIYENFGSWYSWKTPYLTYNNSYLESAWWAFKKFWDKGYVYEGKRPVFWCPKCQTALAGYEATDSYKQLTDPSIYIKFKIKNTTKDNLLVYTTTPWTLPGNVAILVHPNKEYVKVKTDHENLILAKKRLSVLDELKINYKILETFKGEKLNGLEYESILNVPIQKELAKNPKALKVYLSIPILKERVASKIASKKGIQTGDVFEDFVSDEDGSGLVHTAPGHGKTDNMIGKHYNLPELSPLDEACCFTDEVGQFQGEFVKQADHAILDVLDKTDRLLNFSKIEHSYPVCWRCKSPLIFRMSNQWFFKIDDLREKMLKANDLVHWQPNSAKERFKNWVANADDWNFSRQRYWGVPIPIWKCECGETKAVGSIRELEVQSVKQLPKNFDLHTANNVKLKCDVCKNEMTRINDIFDVWFDSGCAPFASLHYPFENKKLFENHYPVSRINESQDQIRGWFYSLMFVGIGVFDKTPYKIISMPGWVLDKNGDKMSKSQGNFISAKEALEDYGADILRFYYFWDIDPASTQRFNLKDTFMEVNKFFNTLWNLHLLVLQAKKLPDLALHKIEDKWILSKWNSVLGDIINHYDSFETHLGTRKLYDFLLDDLSRTYVQFVRDRISNDDLPLRIINNILLGLVKVLASVSPFMSEQIYQNLKTLNKLEESVHLETLPSPEKTNKKLEENMNLSLDIIGLGLACRDKSKIGVRWPLKELIVEFKENIELSKEIQSLILKQLNVKSLNFNKIHFNLKIKPNYKSLGKEFGHETADVIELINTNRDKIVKNIEDGKEKIELGKFKILNEHLIIEKIPPENFAFAESKNALVLLNLETNEDLLNEGFTREIIRRVQQLRKESGLKKTDKIDLFVDGCNKDIALLLAKYKLRLGVKNLLFRKEKFKITDSFKIKDLNFEIGLKLLK